MRLQKGNTSNTMRNTLKAAAVLLFLACGISASAASTPVSNQYKHINAAWYAPNSTYPDCSASITTYCLNTYTFTATDPNSAASIVTVPNGGIAAGGAVAYAWTPGGYLYCGTWTISVTANYVDGAGAGISSSPISVQVAVTCPLTASPATALSGTPAP